MEKEIAGYKILKLLGSGGMGRVYLAQRPGHPGRFALKVANSSLGESGLARLRREAELLSRVKCRHLPRYLGCIEVGDEVALGLEFIDGESLHASIPPAVKVQRSASELPLPNTFDRLYLLRRVLTGVSRALLTMHSEGVIHRDIKPANIIIKNDGTAVLVDLGLARGPGVETLTNTGDAIGTPDYMPPEQVSGGSEVGPCSDLYQLALVARDILLGIRREAGQDAIGLLIHRCSSPPENPAEGNDWIPKYVGKWIQAALDPRPDQRPTAKGHLKAASVIFDLIERERLKIGSSNAFDIPSFLAR